MCVDTNEVNQILSRKNVIGHQGKQPISIVMTKNFYNNDKRYEISAQFCAIWEVAQLSSLICLEVMNKNVNFLHFANLIKIQTKCYKSNNF